MLVSTMTACSLWPTKSEPPTLDAALRAPCPEIPQLVDKSKATQLRWNVAMIRALDECARRHQAVVAAWPRQ